LLGLFLRYGGGISWLCYNISKTDAENEERLHTLIDDAEVPGERLAKLFEPEVLPPETSSGAGEGVEDRDVD